jgi:hypothetical protein
MEGDTDLAAGIPARLTAAQGRRFGLTVGIAFLVIAAIPLWRQHYATAAVLGTLGGLLTFAGLLVPTRLGPIERGWMRLAHAISKVTTPIIMGIMYLLVLTPFGIGRRLFGGNPLEHQPDDRGFWRTRPTERRRSNLSRQF